MSKLSINETLGKTQNNMEPTEQDDRCLLKILQPNDLKMLAFGSSVTNFTWEVVGLKAEFFSRFWAWTLSSFSLVNSRRTRQGFEVNCDSLQDSCNNRASSWSELVFKPVQYSSAKYLTFNSSSILWICRTSFSNSSTVHQHDRHGVWISDLN